MEEENETDKKVTMRQKSPSFKAIRESLNWLYNIEDFNLKKIGEGFFSIVYKVV